MVLTEADERFGDAVEGLVSESTESERARYSEKHSTYISPYNPSTQRQSANDNLGSGRSAGASTAIGEKSCGDVTTRLDVTLAVLLGNGGLLHLLSAALISIKRQSLIELSTVLYTCTVNDDEQSNVY